MTGGKMSPAALRELGARLRCRVEYDVPLARYTTYRIGGPAAVVIYPESADAVVDSLRVARDAEARWLPLGLGSNVLVADRGYDGVVLRVGKGLDGMTRGVDGDPTAWRVGAGLPTPILARRTARAGLAGVHRLIGVPGTVGGGIYMNSGAHGQDFSQVVSQVELVNASLDVCRLAGEEIAWRYRGSGLDGTVVLGATLRLVPGEPAELERDIRQHFRWRTAGTPFNEPCCGSVFRNPTAPPAQVADGGHRRPQSAGAGAAQGRPGPPKAAGAGERGGAPTAGQLIDACGLKGFRVGGAEVSRMHANYIVNTGAATAADVLTVIDAVRTRVFAEFGVELELEVKIIE